MLVAQISDTHLITPGGPGRFGDEKLVALEKCIEAINNLDTLPDVVIHTGDLSDNGSSAELLLAKNTQISLSCLIMSHRGTKIALTS